MTNTTITLSPVQAERAWTRFYGAFSGHEFETFEHGASWDYNTAGGVADIIAMLASDIPAAIDALVENGTVTVSRDGLYPLAVTITHLGAE